MGNQKGGACFRLLNRSESRTKGVMMHKLSAVLLSLIALALIAFPKLAHADVIVGRPELAGTDQVPLVILVENGTTKYELPSSCIVRLIARLEGVLVRLTGVMEPRGGEPLPRFTVSDVAILDVGGDVPILASVVVSTDGEVRLRPLPGSTSGTELLLKENALRDRVKLHPGEIVWAVGKPDGDRFKIWRVGYLGAPTCPDPAITLAINPCAANNGGCAVGAACANANGVAECTCPAGTIGDGHTCTTRCPLRTGPCGLAKPSPCSQGEWACVSGETVCKQVIFPQPDTSCNGIDEDCNGRADDRYAGHTCSVTPSQCQSGFRVTGTTRCEAGVEVCAATAGVDYCDQCSPRCGACGATPCTRGITMCTPGYVCKGGATPGCGLPVESTECWPTDAAHCEGCEGLRCWKFSDVSITGYCPRTGVSR